MTFWGLHMFLQPFTIFLLTSYKTIFSMQSSNFLLTSYKTIFSIQSPNAFFNHRTTSQPRNLSYPTPTQGNQYTPKTWLLLWRDYTNHVLKNGKGWMKRGILVSTNVKERSNFILKPQQLDHLSRHEAEVSRPSSSLCSGSWIFP